MKLSPEPEKITDKTELNANFDFDQAGFGNFFEIGHLSSMTGNYTGKLNFFNFNGESNIDVTVNANIKNELYDDIFDYEHMLKKFDEKKINVLSLKDINVSGPIHIDVPRTYNVLFLQIFHLIPK